MTMPKNDDHIILQDREGGAPRLWEVRGKMWKAVSYIVELEPGTYYLAPWTGDPGRTCVLNSAKVYATEDSARRALSHARRWRVFPDARVTLVDIQAAQQTRGGTKR